MRSLIRNSQGLVTIATASTNWSSFCRWNHGSCSTHRASFITTASNRHPFNTYLVIRRSVKTASSDDIDLGMMSNEEQVQRVRRQLKNEDPNAASQDEGKNAWDSLWQEKITPWDLGKPTPVLISELKSHWNKAQSSNDDVGVATNKPFRSLVPGCGAGYDLITLALHHEQWMTESLLLKQKSSVLSVVVGLDISTTSLLERASTVVDMGIQNSKLQHTSVDLMSGDFFSTTDWKVVRSFGGSSTTNDPSSPQNLQQRDDKFDFIFDYTFFCALHPSLRVSWGEQMARLLTPSTGRLLTVMFPIAPPQAASNVNRLDGPPFPVTVDDYRAVLEPHGIVMDMNTCDMSMPSSPVRVNQDTVSPRVGKELVCWWIHETATIPDEP